MEKPGTPTNSQQFCLRWHNHQASLLGSLPGLLDQSHLTDVTLLAEGKTIKAHKIILSACSTFFAELFRNLDAAPHQHPVIILPGTSFPSICSLLTFMYAGEVNVFEEQISNLLQLAETLGIKGLADFNNGTNDKSSPKSEASQSPARSEKSSPCPTPPTSKQQSPLESFFSRSLNLFPYPPITEPLNYSRNHDLLARLSHTTTANLKTPPRINNNVDENANIECDKMSPSRMHHHTTKPELKRIDKIAESLRTASGKNFFDFSAVVAPKPTSMIPHSPPTSLALKPPNYPPVSSFPGHFMTDDSLPRTPENLMFDSQPSMLNENLCAETLMDKPALPKPSNPKLYATCFICNKKLSNQYNLRVHLETHQNMRYACQVCNHVSRSKDALRKHVSYRHPGTSTCDPDSRRKRNRLNPIPIPLTASAQASMLLSQANLFGSMLNATEAQQLFNKQHEPPAPDTSNLMSTPPNLQMPLTMPASPKEEPRMSQSMDTVTTEAS